MQHKIGQCFSDYELCDIKGNLWKIILYIYKTEYSIIKVP